MRKHLILLFAALHTFCLNETCAQEGDNRKNIQTQQYSFDEYQRFMYRLIGVNTNQPIGALTFDLTTENPVLKINGLVRTRNLKKALQAEDMPKSFLGYSGYLSSKNKYTPLITKEKWVPDAGIQINGFCFAIKNFSFYTKEVREFAINKYGLMGFTENDSGFFVNDEHKTKVVDEMPISQASSYSFFWLTYGIGLNYAQLNVLSNVITVSPDTIFTKYRKVSVSPYFGLNFIRNCSRKSGLSFLGSIIYQYKSNDNNYNSLKDVTITTYTNYNQGNNSLNIKTEEVKGKRGNIRIGNTHNILLNAGGILTINKFYLGIIGHYQRTTASNFQYTDMGFSLNLPVKKKEKEETFANLAVKFDWPDINKELANTSMKDKFRVGFQIGIPLPIATQSSIK